MKRKPFPLLLGVLTFLLAISVHAQVTTASLQGRILDQSGVPLIGATVVATHTPSGTNYGTVTDIDGRYRIANMRIGGPYTIQLTYVGYEDKAISNIFLTLGQKRVIDASMKSASVTLEGVVVSANKNGILNSDRTGSSTNVSNEQIKKLPTISRSAKDFTRLTPSSDGNSFGGRNNKMNNFTLDGSIFNNPFGLDAATPGSQTNAQPVSLDAIDQIQVDIAPFDVRQSGFTGAAVNAVTKSGTNELHGTAFGFYRNQDFTGGKVRGKEIFVPDLNHLQTGFSLGGAIIKNKLFFFANAEIERRSDLGSNYLAARPGLSGPNVSRVSAEDMERVSRLLRDNYGYETGAYEGFLHRTDNNKGLFKLDWNIGRNHNLTATYNFLLASRDKPAHPEAIGRRGPDQTTLQFENSGYTIINNLHSGIVELNSRFSNMFANKFQVGYTAFRDSRDPKSDPFPVININQAGVRAIVAGHEPFSIHNRLFQDVIQASDNLDIYLNKHTITVGFSFEKFLFDNSFNLNTYGGTFGPGFASVDAFEAAVKDGSFGKQVDQARNTYKQFGGDDSPLGVDQDTAKGYQGWALAETNVGQLAFYLQDEINVTPDFTLTLGLRIDRPEYFDTQEKIKENIARNCCYFGDIEYYDEEGNPTKFDHTVLPKETPNISPRFGFNWDVQGDRSTQVRGGSGLFSGRFPFVWIGNQVANPNFFFYCVTREDFRFPQVWRTNLGLDKRLGDGWIGTFDVVYTKDIHAMMVRNYGLKPPSGTLKGVDNRPFYVDSLDRTSFKNDAYVFTNTNLGRSLNVSVQLQKRWDNGMFASLGYDYLDSRDASSIPAEISSDAYARNPAYGNVNLPVLSPSLYGHKHRILGAASKRFEYGGKWATTVSTFFEYVKGGRFSYTYSGDINHDGSNLNDLIYIPTKEDIAKMNFDETTYSAEEQRAALEAYIQQDDYMSANRGKVAGKYALLRPWYSTWDVKIAQEYMLPKGQALEFTVDILNFGNLLNSSWGVRQNPTASQPIGVSTDNDGNVTYSFDPAIKNTFTDDFSLLSRWQAQFGLRFRF